MLNKPQEHIVLGDGARAKSAWGFITAASGVIVLLALVEWSRLGASIASAAVMVAVMVAVTLACSVWFSGRLSISDSVIVLRPDGLLSSPVRLNRIDVVECLAFVERPTTATFILRPMLTVAFKTSDGVQLYLGPFAVRPRHLPRIQKAVEELGGEWRELT